MKKEVKPISADGLIKFITSERKRLNDEVDDFDDLLYVEPNRYVYEFCYGIYLDGLIAGYLTVNKHNPQHCDKLYVSSLHRRKGLASFAIDEIGILSVWVIEGNTASKAMYMSLGFKTVDKQLDMLVFVRDIKK